MPLTSRSQAEPILAELNGTDVGEDAVIRGLLIEHLCEIDLGVDEEVVANITDGQLEDMEE